MHPDLSVSLQQLQASEEPWDYLYLILESYYRLRAKEPDNMMDNFNDHQHTLLAYALLDAQVCNGGFIQLIYNGYGEYIFESPLIETLRLWGLTKTADLLENVFVIYQQAQITRRNDDSLADFSDLYSQFPQFESYDDAYYDVKGAEAAVLQEYVAANLAQFIRVE